MKTLLLLLVALPLCAQERMTFNPQALSASESLGKIKLRKDALGFSVIKDGVRSPIEAVSVDPLLRTLSVKQLQKFSKNGKIKIKQANTGEYSLSAQGNIKGGGPISGAIAYWVTKSVCWGGVATAATAATAGVVAAGVATGGAAIGASAGAIASATGAATAATSIAVGGLGGGAASAVGATIVAGGISATAAGTAAATTATAAAATALGAAGLVAGIESASLSACAAFTLIPFLP
jgi:hypothetical protein